MLAQHPAMRNGCEELQAKVSPTANAIKSAFSSSTLYNDKQGSVPIRAHAFIPRAFQILQSN